MRLAKGGREGDNSLVGVPKGGTTSSPGVSNSKVGTSGPLLGGEKPHPVCDGVPQGIIGVSSEGLLDSSSEGALDPDKDSL